VATSDETAADEPAAHRGDVAARLAADAVPAEVAALVLAALADVEPDDRPAGGPPLRLRSLVVEGFRGIAEPVRLPVAGDAGLTVVVGRTGAGKSSLVEALDLALTGGDHPARRASAGEQWRNEAHDRPAVDVALTGTGPVAVAARWPDGAALDDADVTVSGRCRRAGLVAAGRCHRPVLWSRQERVADGTDRLADVLGFDALADAVVHLAAARDAAGALVAAGRAAAERLAARCDQVDDRRAAATATLLRAPTWDLAALAALAGTGGPAGHAGRLRRLAQAPVPDVHTAAALAEELADARQAAAAVAGVDPAASRRRAALLDSAIAFDGAGPHCPVCRSVPDEGDWPSAAASEAVALWREAEVADRARRRLDAAVAEGVAFVAAAAAVDAELGPAVAAVAAAAGRWLAWSSPTDDPAELEARLAGVPAVVEDVVAVRAAAAAALGPSEHRWPPLARKLAGWLEQAPAWLAAAAELPARAAAASWLADAAPGIRAARLAPVEAQGGLLWDALGQRRDVPLPLPDGAAPPAPGVLSQGERHALALSLFLPRAGLAGSPFGFVVIDDAAQGMDAGRIDVLAGVLADTARELQVVAFTRDERLAAAVAAGPAQVLELVRVGAGRLEVRGGGGVPVG
jgi:hypothetical protein